MFRNFIDAVLLEALESIRVETTQLRDTHIVEIINHVDQNMLSGVTTFLKHPPSPVDDLDTFFVDNKNHHFIPARDDQAAQPNIPKTPEQEPLTSPPHSENKESGATACPSLERIPPVSSNRNNGSAPSLPCGQAASPLS